MKAKAKKAKLRRATAKTPKKAKPKLEPTLARFKGEIMLIGAGKMGGALLQGWLSRGLPRDKITVIEPEPDKRLRALAERGVKVNPPRKGKASVVVLGVKPQIAPDVVGVAAKAADSTSSLVISIMAGRTLAFLEKAFPAGTPIVRAMPNLPASIGRGITVAVGNRHADKRKRMLAAELLGATGSVEWVDKEALLDPVTAVSGSGPAYVFLLAEALTAAAVNAGLPAELAAKLARETIAGSGELLRQSPLDAASLRKNVTSPGGTTAAALDVLMGPGGLETLLLTAVAMATRRSRELAG
jgi:pyrroline-5-carboxylate reductase